MSPEQDPALLSANQVEVSVFHSMYEPSKSTVHLCSIYSYITNPESNHHGEKLKDVTERLHILNDTDKDSYADEKKNLVLIVPAKLQPFMPDGNHKTNRRKDDHIATTCLVYDIDHVNPKDELEKMRRNPYIVMMHSTPSGKGLRVYALVDREIKTDEHKQVYVYYGLQFLPENVKFDDACLDPTRGYYLSYDPNAYFNEMAFPVSVDRAIGFPLPEEYAKKTAPSVKYSGTTADSDFTEDEVRAMNWLLDERVPGTGTYDEFRITVWSTVSCLNGDRATAKEILKERNPLEPSKSINKLVNDWNPNRCGPGALFNKAKAKGFSRNKFNLKWR